ncbi:restriction endonuclease [Pseudonocardia sp. DR1-2]|nr:restriction endonuclease [Pseudonocardia sp. DR1-2]
MFALLEEMGAYRVEWRSSHASINEADGGRDIEATFSRPTPDGDLELETWWIESKRRDRPVKPGVVKEGAINSTSYVGVSTFIVASNSSFTNTTSDWVKRHNSRNLGPTVKLWDRRRLKSLVETYPSAAARTLVSALSFSERCSFLAEYFFENSRVMTEPELREAWSRRVEIDNYQFLVAATYADAAANKLIERPWMAVASSGNVLRSLIVCLTSLLGKVLRGDSISNDLAVKTCAYTIGVACAKLDSETVGSVLDDPYRFLQNSEPVISSESMSVVRQHLFDPCRSALLQDLASRCADDCARCSTDYETIDTKENFWGHFVGEVDGNPMRLTLINEDIPCAAGIELPEGVICPLDSIGHTDSNEDFAALVRTVIEFRVENPSGQYLRLIESTSLGEGAVAAINELIAARLNARDPAPGESGNE